MLGNHLSGTVDRLLHFLPDLRLRVSGNRLPSALELFQRRAEQLIMGPMAMPLERGRDRTDFGVELLSLAFLHEQRVPLGRENFVDALVLAAADIPDEPSKRCWIFNRLRCELPNLCGGAFD